MTDEILHSELLFLPFNLQHVGIRSTLTHHVDVRTALQSETMCVIKERESCAPWTRQESQLPSRAEKLIVDDR